MLGANVAIPHDAKTIVSAPGGTTLTAGSTAGAVGYSSVVPIGSISAQPVAGKNMIELSQFDAGGGITGLRMAFLTDVSALVGTVTISGVLHTESDPDFFGKSSDGSTTSWVWGPLVVLPFSDGVTVPIAATLT